MLSEFSSSLQHRLALPLPGKHAQLRMAHLERRMNLSLKIPADAKKGGVLILFYEDENRIKFPLILRQSYDGVHSGQVAFPGGKFEPGDRELSATAMREAEEEIGIVKEDVQLLGSLSELYIPPSNFLVYPFAAAIHYKPDFIPDDKEVVKVIEVSLDSLMDGTKISEKEIRLSTGNFIQSPCFDFDGYAVWGATAMILSELKVLIEETGSW